MATSSAAPHRDDPARTTTSGRRWRASGTQLVVAGAVLLALVLLATVAIRALGGRDLSAEAYERWVRSGSVAGVAHQLTSGPAPAVIDVAAQKGAYGNTDACGEYWTYAKRHLVRQAESVVSDPGTSLADGISTELWSDGATAEEGQRLWSGCLDSYQSTVGRSSFPLKRVAGGTSKGVAWEYSESLELNNAVHLLTLRQRNVVASFLLPDAPAPDWRDQLAERFRADLDAATR